MVVLKSLKYIVIDFRAYNVKSNGNYSVMLNGYNLVIVVVITACFNCKKSFMAGKKKMWLINLITSPAVGRCGKKLV